MSLPAGERRNDLPRLTTSPGLCAHCLHLRLVASVSSTFVRCSRADGDGRFAKYPRLPVLVCDGYDRGEA